MSTERTVFGTSNHGLIKKMHIIRKFTRFIWAISIFSVTGTPGKTNIYASFKQN